MIVVDDASTDDTAEVAEAFGAQVIRHERNLGAAAAYESGLRAASHEWVALLDDDDEWLPHHLEHALVAHAGQRAGGLRRASSAPTSRGTAAFMGH